MTDTIIEVNYAQSLEEMIAAGRYKWVDSDITYGNKFMVQGEGLLRFEYRLLDFGGDIRSEEVEGAIKGMTWEAARIEHLLAFRKKYPRGQRKLTIIAIGSIAEIHCFRQTPGISWHGVGRNLSLHCAYNWNEAYRFLVVRKFGAA